MEKIQKIRKKVTMPEVDETDTKDTAPSKPISGSGMDRVVEKKGFDFRRWGLIGLAVIVVAYLIYTAVMDSMGRSLQVNESRIQISTVKAGTFEDFIPVRGRVTPAQTVFLDAIEGGRVEEILVEDGATLKAGDLIVKLSNAQLQLNVLSNEARVAEQLNNMRSIELRLEQNRLQHKRNLVDINYQIKMLTRQEAREAQLVENGTIPVTKYQDTKDTLDWYKNRLDVTLESQKTDTRMQEEQLVFLKSTSARLEGNLEISRQNLDNMNVRAPVDGKLSGFDVEIGQSIPRGERLGQIDTPNNYKLTANIGQYYLGRVDIGQKAEYEDYELVISKIYPQVTNDRFEVDLKFVGKQPERIRRGQTIQTRLTLGDDSEALLIPNGTFYQDTGGNWIFVVTADGSEAVKRPIKMGRRNSRFIEVLEGLEEGERVVTSPYTSFRDMDRLTLTN